MTFNFFIISAMYENGGNTLQRHLDGHSKLFVYPFESQLGTKNTCDYVSSFVPHKYRWPQFQFSETGAQMYDDIWDEEVKFRLAIPYASKFRDVDIVMRDKERKKIFLKLLGKKVTRARVIESFFKSTFYAWKNYHASGKEDTYVGYNPVQILDAEKIVEDFPKAKLIHIVRNPFSAFAETKHRPFPLSLSRYIYTWNVVQMSAISFAERFPKNVILVRFEDLIENKKKFFVSLCEKLQISFEENLLYPSWNGKKLENQYPWGTVQYPTPLYNKEKIEELSKDEHSQIKALTHQFNEYFNYTKL